MTDKDLGALQRQGASVPTEGHGAAVLVPGELLAYDMGEGVSVRCTYRGDCEGWPMVSFDADGPDAVAVHVRPSRVRRRTTAANSVGTDERSEEVNQNQSQEGK